MLSQIEFLLPNSEVEFKIVHSEEHAAGAQRLASILIGVWKRIECGDRLQISSHWKEKQDEDYPRIFFQDPWMGGEENLAGCGRRGLEIEIDWRTARLMPDDPLCVVLVHELAHVYQFAIAKGRFALSDEDVLGTIRISSTKFLDEKGRAELHADETIVRWGFDYLAAVAWLKQFTIIKDGVATLRKKPLTKKYARSEARRMKAQIYHGGLWGQGLGTS